MNIKSVYFVILLLQLYSCSPKPDEAEEEYQFFEAPLTYPLNTKEGYKINPVSGDSIKPIINSFGDTVKTGIPIALVGKVIDPQSVQKPKVVRAGKPKGYLGYTNEHVIPENLTAKVVDESKLNRIKLGEGDSTFILVNSLGDTVPTGKPIPAISKKIQIKHPLFEPALPLRMKETPACNIQYLNVDQGMTYNQIHTMLQDNRGNIWVGSWGNGILRYNGSSFTNYTEKEGLVHNFLFYIMEDKSGNLWFGCGSGIIGGITYFNGTSFTNYTEKEGLPNHNISSILEDKNGNFWIGTFDGGVSRFDGTSFTNYTVKEGLPNNKVSSILEDKNGNLWFGTQGGGASCFDGTTFTTYTEKEGLSSNSVFCMREDKFGKLWFGFGVEGAGGASCFDGITITNYTEKEGLINNEVSDILEDKNGNLWFTTFRGGISRYDGTSFTNYAEKEGMHGIAIESILEDDSGNLWFGTGAYGVSFYDVALFLQYYFLPNTNNSCIVYCLLEDKSGNLWIGTENNGVYRYNGKTFTNYTEKEGLSNNEVLSILEDRSGNLWFGTSGGGVSRFDGTNFTNFTEKEGLSNNYVKCSLEDKNGNLWFGTLWEGLSCFNGTEFTHYSEKEGLSSHRVHCMLEDKKGNLWFGTLGGGVSRFDETSFTNYTEKEGLCNNYVSCILEDKAGNLWFGTWGGGVTRYDGVGFTNYTEKEGLSNNKVTSILEDENGNLWINTVEGMNYVVIEGVSDQPLQNTNQIKTSYPKIYGLGRQDGFKDMELGINGALIDGRNRAWWGTMRGLTMLDLNKFTIPAEPPRIYLSQLDINEQFIDYHQLLDSTAIDFGFSAVSPFENYPLNLELPYYKNHLTFHYYGIDWTAPHKLKYAYQLEGLKNEWSSPTEDIKVDYRNLSAGTYTFKVKAIGMAQVWSQPFEYTFTILPPLWRSDLAYGFYLLLIIGGAYFTNRYLRNRLLQKERKRNYENELKQKATELEMQALRAQMNPHFIFNSLNSINNFILKNDKLQASEYLIKFSKLIRLILENSTLTLISLGQELEALKLYIELEALRFQHRFDYQIIFSKDLDITSIKVPPLILQPFVENAIHHGLMPKEGPGHLKITIAEKEGELFLKIEDDGIGRYKSNLINTNASHKHKSLGLKVTTERIGFLNHQHAENSKVEVNDLTDEDGKALGTEISINIPVII
jgi:ligand-binding sensor domain-containing protein